MARVINDGTRPRICKTFRFCRCGKLIIVEVKIKNIRRAGRRIPFPCECLPLY